MLPFLVGGVLMIVYRDSLAAPFRSNDPTFYENVLGEERTRRLEDKAGSRLQRVDESWLPRVMVFFGICLIVISLIVISGLLA